LQQSLSADNDGVGHSTDMDVHAHSSFKLMRADKIFS